MRQLYYRDITDLENVQDCVFLCQVSGKKVSGQGKGEESIFGLPEFHTNS